EQQILDAIETILEEMGYQVEGFRNSEEGEREAIENDYDLILIDIKMPGKDGAAVTQSILKVKPAAVILVITGHPADPLAQRALNAGAKALLKKPFEMAKILDFLRVD
ncbi:MAG: response regulator, partial [Spirochaetota bacterium]